MRAVTCRRAQLEVRELPDPVPAKGQLLLQVERAGICGSDLHARLHADEVADLTEEGGYDGFMRSEQQVVLGHEYSGTVLDHGPGASRRLRAGQLVVAMPLLQVDGHTQLQGLCERAPGAYAERILTQDALTFAVPDGLSAESAALTEPMAVALHAVRRGEVGRRQTAIVLGCGPVGLAVIAMLKATGVRTVIASDPTPRRRELARAMGADLVVDPGEESPFSFSRRFGHVDRSSDYFDQAPGAMRRLRSLPRWSSIFRLAEKAGAATPKAPVVFECVGVPGMIESVLRDAPLLTRVVVVGVCMQADEIRPVRAINKELDLRFVLGYSPLDFHDSLTMLAEGTVTGEPLITGTVGLDGVAGAFAALADPQAHAKIMIDPASSPAR